MRVAVPAGLSILYAPGATIARVVEEDPRRWVLFLAALGGLGWAVSFSWELLVDAETGGVPLLVLPFLVVAGPGALVALYVHAALLRLTGRWLGGRAAAPALRAAIAWSSLPSTAAHLLWLPGLVAELTSRGAARHGGELPLAAPLQLAVDLANVQAAAWVPALALLWSVVLQYRALAAVQGFSGWRAIANDAFARLLPVAAAVAIGALAFGLGSLVR